MLPQRVLRPLSNTKEHSEYVRVGLIEPTTIRDAMQAVMDQAGLKVPVVVMVSDPGTKLDMTVLSKDVI